jgi:hypothetical protein
VDEYTFLTNEVVVVPIHFEVEDIGSAARLGNSDDKRPVAVTDPF